MAGTCYACYAGKHAECDAPKLTPPLSCDCNAAAHDRAVAPDEIVLVSESVVGTPIATEEPHGNDVE